MPPEPAKPDKSVLSLKRPKFRADTCSKIVTIEIGPERKKYFIHTALLTHHSEYFKKALNGPWKEAAEGVIPLDDVDCETFDIFVDWLYIGEFPIEERDWISHPAKDSRSSDIQLCLLRIKICIFGDRFLAPGFKRAAQNNLIDCIAVDHRLPWYPMIIYAFDNLPPGHVILRLLVDAHCSLYVPDSDSEQNGELQARDQLPVSFLVQVMLRYATIKQESGDAALNRCDYHDHATKEERKKCEASAPKWNTIPQNLHKSDSDNGSDASDSESEEHAA